MKNLKKAVLTTTALALGVTSFSAYASNDDLDDSSNRQNRGMSEDRKDSQDDSDDDRDNSSHRQNRGMSEDTKSFFKEAKEDRKDSREERKVQRKELKEQNKVLRDKAKSNREDFRSDDDGLKAIFLQLNQETQVQLRTVFQKHKEAVSLLKKEASGSGATIERQEAIKTEIKTLHDALVLKVKELTGKTTEIDAFFAKKAELMTKNEALRAQQKLARTEFRQGRDTMVEQYKDRFFSQLSGLVPKLSDAKLDTVSKKIDTLIETMEDNTKLTTEKKDKFLAQIISIKELLEEELDNRNNIADDTTTATSLN